MLWSASRRAFSWIGSCCCLFEFIFCLILVCLIGRNRPIIGFSNPKVCLPGILAIEAPKYENLASAENQVERFTQFMQTAGDLKGFPLLLLVDDADFTAAKLNNFLWVTFTRSNPSHDVYGIDSFIEHKHWGCRGALVIDARIKPHHAPPLVEDPAITRRVDALAAKGGPLHGLF